MAEVLYRCACCKKMYSTMEEANACEVKHAEFVEIVKQEYGEEGIFPEKVSLKFQLNKMSVTPDVVTCNMSSKVFSYIRKDIVNGATAQKWYVGICRGEGTSSWVMQLTDAEYAAVQKFLECTDMIVNESYSGICSISEGFETREQAVAKALSFDF